IGDVDRPCPEVRSPRQGCARGLRCRSVIRAYFSVLSSAFAPLVVLPARALATNLGEQLQIAAKALETGCAHRRRYLALQCRLRLVAGATYSLGHRREEQLLVGDGRGLLLFNNAVRCSNRR